MNLLAKILPVANILVDHQAKDKSTIFETIGVLFERETGVSSARVCKALEDRERLCSTGLGQGVAIPHGRIKGIKTPLGAFVRLAQAIDFGAPDGLPVNLIFIILVPEQANETHLQLLSELATLFSDRECREALSQAPDAKNLHHLLVDWSPNAANQRRAAI